MFYEEGEDVVDGFVGGLEVDDGEVFDEDGELLLGGEEF